MATHYDHSQNTGMTGTSAGMIALAVLVVLVVAAVYTFSGNQTANAPMATMSEEAAPQTGTGSTSPAPALPGQDTQQGAVPVPQPAQ